MTVVGSRLWWPACIGLVLLLIAPLFIVEVPPIQDYPNHLARLYVLAFGEGDPVLSTMYAPRWSINPNLAIDIIGPPLMHLLPLHVAGRVLLALALLLPLAGVVAYARAAFGAWSWWSLAGGTVAYNAIFILGFLNLLIGVGVALLGAAVWIGLRERHPALAVAGGAAMSVVVFFCHFIGELFFALLIGAEEAVRAWRLWRTGRLTARDLAVVATFPAIALAPALILYVLSPISNSTGPTPFIGGLRKIYELFVPFLAHDKLIALLSGVAVVGLMLAFRRRFAAHGPAAFALAALVVVYAIAPGAMKGIGFISTRIPAMIGFLLFGGFRPSFNRIQGALVTAGVVALLLLRVGSVGVAWYGQREDLAELRQAIAPVAPGSRVLVATAASASPGVGPASEPASRLIPDLSRTDRHMAALLLIERHAFWPLLAVDPRTQPVAILPPYDRIAFPFGEPPDYRALDRPSAEDLRLAPYLADWRANFDYVLVMDAGAAGDLSRFRDGLTLLRQTDFAALLRIER